MFTLDDYGRRLPPPGLLYPHPRPAWPHSIGRNLPLPALYQIFEFLHGDVRHLANLSCWQFGNDVHGPSYPEAVADLLGWHFEDALGMYILD